MKQRLLRRYAALRRSLSRRSRSFVAALPRRIEWLLPAWIAIFMAFAIWKTATALTPIRSLTGFAEVFLPYALIALAPSLGYRLTRAAYPHDHAVLQPGLRLSVFGRWRRVSREEAQRHPAYGPFGFIASLLLGLILNVPVRALEFVVAVPAMNLSAPPWGSTLFLVMAFDVAAMSFIYVVAFVMALRSVSLFPRMMVVAWTLDLFLQLAIARAVAAAPGLPERVAEGLNEVLQGNVTKVMISVGVWAPYLILSTRVNVTYRQRVERD